MSIVIYAIPLYLVLIIMELVIDVKKGTGYYRLNDAFGSLSLGILSRSSKLVVFSLGALFIDKLLPELRLYSMSSDSLWVWVFTFVAYDLTYYWSHRMGHTLNFFWAGHGIHHSSEEYNLTTALRQSSSGIWGWIFSIPLLMAGVPVDVFVTCAGLNLIYQFWVHTRLIDRMWSWYEWLMVTPSHHRVHHAQNAVYIDKNHGGVFIVWDKLFGTFQKELKEEEVIYGIRKPLESFNPFWANAQIWFGLIQDAWRTSNWWDKCRIWFMPTGWRPADVEAKFPVQKSDLSKFEKYNPPIDVSIQWYGFMQLVMNVVLLVYFLFHFGNLSYTLVFLGFVLISLPLITTGWLFEGRRFNWECYRLVLSWVGVSMAVPLMANSSLIIFFGYLSLTTLHFCGLLWVRRSPKEAVQEGDIRQA